VTFGARGPANAEALAALETDVLAGFAGLERDTDSFGILPNTIAVISASGRRRRTWCGLPVALRRRDSCPERRPRRSPRRA
jgi:hypothetical protein